MSRLEKILGTEIVDDIRLGHTRYEYGVLEWFIYDEQPDWFVEIGVHEGGLAYLLLQNFLFSEVSYMGIELYCDLVRPHVKTVINNRLYSDLWCVDCFSEPVASFVDVLPNKIIYCDGGNKPRELFHFKGLCHPGDIIMTHDFYDGTRVVRGVPVENISIEVVAEDIAHMEEDETFERLDEELFKDTRIIGWRKT